MLSTGFKAVVGLVLLCLVSARGQITAQPVNQRLDDFLQEMQSLHEVPGMAIGVIKGGEVLYETYLGQASLEHQVPVSDSTLFRIYSTTKLIVNVAIFQLLQADQLRLDRPVKTYLPQIPDAWSSVTVQHLLVHSSGIPDFTQFESSLSNAAVWSKLRELPLLFSPGTYHNYNQTNYWLLAQLIEKISGQTLADFIADRQFAGDQTGWLFSSNSFDAFPNRVYKYQYNSERTIYSRSVEVEQSRGLAGNGFNTNLNRMLAWCQDLMAGKLLKANTIRQMWKPFQFKEQDIAFAHGWGIYQNSASTSFGFTGGGVSAVRVFPEQDLAIVVLTNGYRYFSIHNDLVNGIASRLFPELRSQSADLFQQTIKQFISDEFLVAAECYQTLVNEHPKVASEGFFNRLGYRLMAMDKLDAAVSIFERNTVQFPNSSNVYDSLGEAYLKQGEVRKALRQYQKALALNPESQNAQRMIERLEADLDH